MKFNVTRNRLCILFCLKSLFGICDSVPAISLQLHASLNQSSLFQQLFLLLLPDSYYMGMEELSGVAIVCSLRYMPYLSHENSKIILLQLHQYFIVYFNPYGVRHLQICGIHVKNEIYNCTKLHLVLVEHITAHSQNLFLLVL